MVIIDAAGHSLDAASSPSSAAGALRLRVRLLRAPRLAARRARASTRCGRRSACAREGAPSRRRRRHSGARLGRAARDRLRAERWVPFEMGLIRSHYVGRTFIEPQQSHPSLRRPLQAEPGRAAARAASASSSSTTRSSAARRRRKIVKMVRDAGAREVHLRISSPPTAVALLLRHRHADASRAHRVEPLGRGDRRYVTADSLGYLSLDGLARRGRR